MRVFALNASQTRNHRCRRRVNMFLAVPEHPSPGQLARVPAHCRAYRAPGPELDSTRSRQNWDHAEMHLPHRRGIVVDEGHDAPGEVGVDQQFFVKFALDRFLVEVEVEADAEQILVAWLMWPPIPIDPFATRRFSPEPLPRT